MPRVLPSTPAEIARALADGAIDDPTTERGRWASFCRDVEPLIAKEWSSPRIITAMVAKGALPETDAGCALAGLHRWRRKQKRRQQLAALASTAVAAL